MDVQRPWSIPISHLGVVLNTVTILFFALSVFAVALRIWSIHLVPRSYNLHDHLVCAALLPAAAFTISACLTTRAGIGYHVTEITPENFAILLKLFVSGEITWLTATTLIRMSVLFFYLDLFQVQRYFRYAVYATMALVVAEFIGLFVTAFTICQPFSYLWTKTGPGSCGNTVTEEVAAAYFMMFTDAIVVLLPAPVVSKLNMPKQKRRRVMAIFAVGLLVCLVSLARLIVTKLFSQADYSYGIVGPTVLTGLETYIGMMNACLPTVQPALARIHVLMFGQKTRPLSTCSWEERTELGARTQSPRVSRLPQDTEWEKKVSVTVESVPVDHSSTSSLSHNNIRVTRDVIVEHGAHGEISMV